MTMAADLNNEKLIASYLLGELSEEQQVEIEDRAFEDRDYLASITAVENDLIDEYVRDEMSAAERSKFENRFLASTERRQRVVFAKTFASIPSESTLTEASSTTARPAATSWRDSLEAFFRGLNPAAKFAMAAVVLLIVVGSAWLLTERLRLRNQLGQLNAEKQSQQDQRQAMERQMDLQRRQNEELNARLNQEKQQREQSEQSLRELGETGETGKPPARSIIASLTLLPGLSRGGNDKPKLVLQEANLVRLQIGIEPEEEYKTYAVELRTRAGRQIWTRENLTARNRGAARAIGLTLPASALKPGEYELKLSGKKETGGTEDVGFYYFDVIKRSGQD
jgi:hypothetical protein